MAKWEDNLPPIVRERLAKIGNVTPEEKNRIKESERLDVILSEFYKGQLNAEGLQAKLKDEKRGVLSEAQVKIANTFGITSSEEEYKRRKDGLMVIESLKKDHNTAMLENEFKTMATVRKRYVSEKEQAYNTLKQQIEKNPQLRLQQVQQGQNTAIMQLSVDEAIKRNPQWQQFLQKHEQMYTEGWVEIIQKLKNRIK